MVLIKTNRSLSSKIQNKEEENEWECSASVECDFKEHYGCHIAWKSS